MRPMPDQIALDIDDIAGGKVELSSFAEKLASFDLTPYKDMHVQIQGCAPTWAHLMVAGKLFPIVKALDFIIDDRQGEKIVSILKK